MPRLRLTLPAQTIFTTQITVRVTDINYGNHLANDALLGLLHEARINWIRQLGFKNEQDVGGTGLILADAAIVFRAEAFLGEVLQIDLRLGEMGRSGLDLYYHVRKQQDQQVVAQAKTHIAFFDYETRRIAAMPAGFKSCLEQHGGTSI